MRDWWRRPRLALRQFDPTSPDGWILQLRHGGHIAFARLRLQNVGRSEARDVEVVIEQLVDETPPEIAELRTTIGPAMADGLAGRQLKWADRDEPAINIPAGTVRRFDIINIVESDLIAKAEGENLIPLRIGLFAESISGRHILVNTVFTLILTVSGSNFVPVEHRISVSFSGTWNADTNNWSAMGNTLQIRVDDKRWCRKAGIPALLPMSRIH